MRKKHYVVYFENTNLIFKTSKEWASENQHYFPNHTFVDSANTPTSNAIDLLLVDNLGFTLVADEEKFVCYKLVNN